MDNVAWETTSPNTINHQPPKTNVGEGEEEEITIIQEKKEHFTNKFVRNGKPPPIVTLDINVLT